MLVVGCAMGAHAKQEGASKEGAGEEGRGSVSRGRRGRLGRICCCGGCGGGGGGCALTIRPMARFLTASRSISINAVKSELDHPKAKYTPCVLLACAGLVAFLGHRAPWRNAENKIMGVVAAAAVAADFGNCLVDSGEQRLGAQCRVGSWVCWWMYRWIK